LVDIMHDLTRHDEMRLQTLIETHRRHTNSAKAGEILGNWKDYRTRFVKVMPVEYRKALQKMQDQVREEVGVSVAIGA
jgi:glutamate synthase (NADPH/NADH) large chain